MTSLPHVDSARRFFTVAGAVLLGLVFSGTSSFADELTPARIKAVTSAVDGAMIRANTATSADWPTVGLDYAETRFSKLQGINSDNVGSLGLVWSYSLDSSRGVEATPVVVDGIMYQTASWSVVHAIDARTGKKIWTFDPGVTASRATRAAAMWSIAASRCGRARCSLPPMTAG
jgi:quinohemoprotein ethanol dehydrogenase